MTDSKKAQERAKIQAEWDAEDKVWAERHRKEVRDTARKTVAAKKAAREAAATVPDPRAAYEASIRAHIAAVVEHERITIGGGTTERYGADEVERQLAAFLARHPYEAR